MSLLLLLLTEGELIAEIDDDRLLGIDNLEGIAFCGIEDTKGVLCRRDGVFVISFFIIDDLSVNFRVNGDEILLRFGTEEIDPNRELALELIEELAILLAGGGVGFTKL